MYLVQLLFGFKGRINRTQYWLGNGLAGLIGFVLLFSFGATLAPVSEPIQGKPGIEDGGALATLAFFLVMLMLGWWSLALQAKRFHDRGRSGYWALAPMVPWTMIITSVMGGIAAGAPAEQVVPSTLPWFGVLALINSWLFIDLGLLAGTNGPNKYDHTPGSGGSAPFRGGGKSTSSPAPAFLGGAEKAMERAIATQARQPQPVRAAPAAAAPRGFGRRATS